jgi:hypothetical protein
MGTINYGTSDFITIGYDCSVIDYDDKYHHEIIQDNYDQIAYRLKDYRFYYFNVKLEPGYYEGYYINIEFNYSLCLDDYHDKRAAQKEITLIKRFLLECINDFDCVACYPGWSTGYDTYNASLKELDDAIYLMRETVKQTPTYRQFIKNNGGLYNV